MQGNAKYHLLVDIGSSISKGFFFQELIPETDTARGEWKLLARCESPTLSEYKRIKENLIGQITGWEKRDYEEIVSRSPALEGVHAEGARGEEGLVTDFCKNFAGRITAGGGGVLLLEVGSSKIWHAFCEGEEVEVNQGSWGNGRGALRLIRRLSGIEAISRWVCSQVSPEEIGDYVGNKSIFSAQLPTNEFASEVEGAMLRESLGLLQEELAKRWNNVEEVLLAGAAFSSVENYRSGLLAFLDGTQMQGLCQLWLDRWGTVPVLGGLDVEIEPFLVNLGTVLAFSHSLPEGERVARIFLDLGLKDDLEVIVSSGDLVCVPLEEGQRAQLSLEMSYGVELPGFDPEVRIDGGQIGLVIDGRARPLFTGRKDGNQLVENWRESLGIY